MSVNVKRWFILMSLVTLSIIAWQGKAIASNSSVEILGFRITFEGVYYNAATNESTWTYRVQGMYSGPHDLSHWILQLCGANNTHVVPKQGGQYKASHDAEVSNNPDPHHGVRGIKFDVEVNKNGGDTVFWFVLEGNWEVGEVQIAGKAGRLQESDTILGPSCIPELCQIEYSVSHGRTDLRALRPGVYASKLTVINLSGTGAAEISFDEFDHAQYLVDSSAPAVQLEYSIGSTIEEADAHGWLLANDFNGSSLLIDKTDVQAGVEIVIWIRFTIGDHNFSSDYESSGKVSITPICA